MKRYFTLLCLALLMPAMSASAGKIVTSSLTSKILGAEVKYNVYLPENYSADRHYPAVYLLHGLYDSYTAWAEKGNMKIVVDELIGTGEACEMVIIMPNAGGKDVKNIWNGYFNMPGWSYEDFFFQEFIPAVEKQYNCGGCKGSRAVMGLSMGGGGSTVYAQRHPDMFSSCYAMSAWLDNKAQEVSTGSTEKDCFYYLSNAVREHSALDFLDNADEATLEKLRTVAWFVDCGDDDFLFDMNIAFHQKMRDRGVHSELRVRNGVHNWEYWHLALRWSLPFATRNFSK
ncbi:MAG: esterase family protein [Bacteroidales bacterium]|nr:esterase family protein [Bacteroidales bacterium]